MKNKEYIGLWCLLSVGLIIFLVIAFSNDIEIRGWTVKKAPFRETLTAKADTLQTSSLTELEDSVVVEEIPEVIETDSLPQSIFIFGDSMTFNLALRMAQYARQNGHSINSVNWDSSNTKIWADHDTLQYYIDKFHPTQIFISLGSNEMYFKNPETRAPYVKRIIEVIDTIPFVWIGPPNWKKDTGINDMLERMCGKRRFFRSEGMEFKRKADHIHPTRESSAYWVDSIMRWLPKSAHPFLAATPPDSARRSNPHIVFLKALNK